MSKTNQDINRQAGEEHEEFHRQQDYSREECETLADMVKSQPAQGHTPGPWEVRLSSGSDGRFISIIGETWPLAHVYTNEIVECEANARLIAAAPDLLAALKIAGQVLDNYGMRNTPAKRQVHAAIAKAEGRAQ